MIHSDVVGYSGFYRRYRPRGLLSVIGVSYEQRAVMCIVDELIGHAETSNILRYVVSVLGISSGTDMVSVYNEVSSLRDSYCAYGADPLVVANNVYTMEIMAPSRPRVSAMLLHDVISSCQLPRHAIVMMPATSMTASTDDRVCLGIVSEPVVYGISTPAGNVPSDKLVSRNYSVLRVSSSGMLIELMVFGMHDTAGIVHTFMSDLCRLAGCTINHTSVQVYVLSHFYVPLLAQRTELMITDGTLENVSILGIRRASGRASICPMVEYPDSLVYVRCSPCSTLATGNIVVLDTSMGA